jgi:chemosensory pili system protein ChpA (sensor histidine kinase/response regulator)
MMQPYVGPTNTPASGTVPTMSSRPDDAESYSLDQLRVQLSATAVPVELMEIFSEEAEDHLSTIYKAMDNLGRGESSALPELRRAAHTLKGAAGAVGLEAVMRLAHRMEDMLDWLVDNECTTTPEQQTLLLSTADCLQDLTTADLTTHQERLVKQLAFLYAQYDRSMAALTASIAPTQTAAESPAAGSSQTLSTSLAHPPAEKGSQVETASNGSPTGNSRVTKLNSLHVDSNADANPSDDRGGVDQATDRSAPVAGANSGSFLRVPLRRHDELVRTVGELIINRSALEQRLSDFGRHLEELNRALDRLKGAAADIETRHSVEALRSESLLQTPAASNPLPWASAGNDGAKSLSRLQISPQRFEEFDSLEFDRYTDFHLVARTLSESTGDVGTVSSELRTLLGDLESLLNRQARLNRDTQDRLMRVRMVPVSQIVTRLGRAIRGVAASQQKRVRLDVIGEDTEVDKSVLEQITDALLHLVRNAVDHGIESAEERLAAGKPIEATIRLEAFHQGTQVTLRVIDDGRGLDVDRIIAAAVRRGLLSSPEGVSDAEAVDLIFAPGLSTATQVSEVSGRGVGMDVVAENVRRLGGTIRVDSNRGKGVTFTIHLPTTLAVTRALLVSASGQTFALPLAAVEQIRRLSQDEVRQLGETRIVEINGHNRRLVRLAQHLGLPGNSDPDRTAVPLLLVRAGDDQAAVAVDRIMGSQDIVVKGLGSHLRQLPRLLGVTVRGDGTVIPILDPGDLVGAQPTAVAYENVRHTELQQPTAEGPLNVMLVDDSVSVRRVMSGLIRNQGWNALMAKDGVDAMEQLSRTEVEPDIFLLDMEMPRMDGLELLNTLRNHEKYRRKPVVIVTSRGGEKHRQKALGLGASGYVVKPYRDDQLLQLIEQLTGDHASNGGSLSYTTASP